MRCFAAPRGAHDRPVHPEGNVVPLAKVQAMTDVYDKYAPVWKALTPEASLNVRKGNYERIFDEARRRVRAWEKRNVTKRSP
jgi:hypothetical protein